MMTMAGKETRMVAKVGEREGAGLVDPVEWGRGYGDGRRIFREGLGDGWGSAKLIFLPGKESIGMFLLLL